MIADSRILRYHRTPRSGGSPLRTKENPGAKDLTDPSFPPVRAIYEKVQSFLAELLAGAVARSGLAAAPMQVTGLLVSAMRAFKENTRDGARCVR